MEKIVNAIMLDNMASFKKEISSKGADISDNNGWTPLMLCIQKGRKEMIDFLLSQDFDINKKNALGNTALFYAVFYSGNSIDLIKTLISKGADYNMKNNAGISPLILANRMSNDAVKQFMNSL